MIGEGCVLDWAYSGRVILDAFAVGARSQVSLCLGIIAGRCISDSRIIPLQQTQENEKGPPLPPVRPLLISI